MRSKPLSELAFEAGGWGIDVDQFGDIACVFQSPKSGDPIRVIASRPRGEYQWDHVSVSLRKRCPNWPEMCHIKDIFWAEDETVVQYHPPKSVYVNFHPYVLHMWKPAGIEIPLPPHILVGPKPGEVMEWGHGVKIKG